MPLLYTTTNNNKIDNLPETRIGESQCISVMNKTNYKFQIIYMYYYDD
jgi:hypothetical protein